MRTKLSEALKANSTPGNWDHVLNQIGMFTFTGLTKDQVKYMTETHFIFLTPDGRISMAGLNEEKCKYLANAMKDAIEKCP